MSTRPIPPNQNRQEKLSELFESVCGTTVIHEQQEEQRHQPNEEDGESPTIIETYLEQNLRSDGLEDAIGHPDQ